MKVEVKQRDNRDQIEGSRAVRGILIGLAFSMVLWVVIIAVLIAAF